MTDFQFTAQENVQYDPESNTYRVSHDWTSTKSLSTVIASVLEEVTSTSTDRLTPLYDSIDPDALDEVFQTDSNGEPRTDGWVRFPYDVYEVTVHASGDIAITETSGEESSNGEQ